MLYRKSLIAHQWSPTVPKELEYVAKERQWLLIGSQGETKTAFLHCYIACQSTTSNDFISWNENLFFLITQEAIKLRRQGFMVLAMGDFNSKIGVMPGLEGNRPDKNRNAPMFLNFSTEVNLFILNTLPTCKDVFTRFMGDNNCPQTGSLLDYGLIDTEHVNTCTSFTIDSDVRFDCGTDHALLECDIVLGSSPHVNWAYHDVLQYNYNDSTDFTAYQGTLDNNIQTITLSKFTAMETSDMLVHVTNNLNLSAKQTFGLKVRKKKRQGRQLPKSTVSLIKSKNLLVKSLHSSPPSSTQEKERMMREIEALKLRIRDSISEVKIQKRARLRSRLLKGDPTRKRFWRFLKDQMKSAGSITAVYKVFYQILIKINILFFLGR